MDAQLVLNQLSGGYGQIQIINKFSLSLNKGQVAFIIGRNGVGKSTLIKMITGHLPLMSGTIHFDQRNIHQVSAHQYYKIGISYAPQERIVFDSLTVLQNLALQQHHLNLEHSVFQKFPRIKERLKQQAGVLSGGEKKILSFCRIMLEKSKLNILDEPTEGVQPENIGIMAQMIQEQTSLGASFIIVDQNLNLMSQVAHHVYLLEHGECLFSAPNSTEIQEEIVKRLQI